MSKYQQIRVFIEPYYEKSLAKDFPRLHRLLAAHYPNLPDKDPPLLDLVPILVAVSREKGVDPQAASALLSHGKGIVSIHAQVNEELGAWNLGRAEKLLNDLEDGFADLEKDLPY